MCFYICQCFSLVNACVQPPSLVEIQLNHKILHDETIWQGSGCCQSHGVSTHSWQSATKLCWSSQSCHFTFGYKILSCHRAEGIADLLILVLLCSGVETLNPSCLFIATNETWITAAPGEQPGRRRKLRGRGRASGSSTCTHAHTSSPNANIQKNNAQPSKQTHTHTSTPCGLPPTRHLDLSAVNPALSHCGVTFSYGSPHHCCFHVDSLMPTFCTMLDQPALWERCTYHAG